MKNTIKILMVVALATIGFGAMAQQEVKKNSVHVYKMGDLVSSSKYLWRVQKNNSGTNVDAVYGTDYIFVNSYTDLAEKPTTGDGAIALAKSNDDIKNADLAKIEQNIIYIKWLAEGTYSVTARVFDTDTDCSDEDYNMNTFTDITVGENNISGDLKWDVETGDGDDVADCATHDEGESTITNFTISIYNHRVPKNPDNIDDATKYQWKYKYKYIVTDTDAEPADGAEGWKNGEDGAFKVVDFDKTKYVEAEKKSTFQFPIKYNFETGDGQWYLWVKITELRDGYGTAWEEADGSLKTIIKKATFNKIPTRQEITTD